MDLRLQILNLGKIRDIFQFYKYLIAKLGLKNHALLESIQEETREILFSFIGIEPDLILKVNEGDVVFQDIRSELGELVKENGARLGSDNDSFEKSLPFEDKIPIDMKSIDCLKRIFPVTRPSMPELLPRKIFSGGLLGYIGYDVVAPFVGYKTSAKSQHEFPDIVMGLFTKILAYSHLTKDLYYVINSLQNPSDFIVIENVFKKYKAIEKKKGVVIRSDFLDSNLSLAGKRTKSNTSLEKWISMVEKTKERIVEGDIIQAVISRKMIAHDDFDPICVYNGLRHLNPSAYMFYLNFENINGKPVRLIGSSPEALITKNQERLNTVPIAGTRRRGKNDDDEKKMEAELLNSKKELAEHVMLVDLARNDLSRVSIPGTVNTTELIRLKKFPNVMHLTSNVESISRLDPFTILKSMFPAGTVSGAPKKRAMEIIHELEVDERGPYA
ncbi:MAG: anthranilate synthase component I family protein, partial [Promethearchaeota archaeon]